MADGGLLGSLEESARREHRCPLDYARLTNPQRAYVSHVARMLLWRGGNSIGKSFGNAWDTLHEARGTHPFRFVARPPIEMLVIGQSFAQMDPLCAKLWALVPRHELDPRVEYVPAQGFRGFKEPVLPFIAGPGAGSVIRFATYEQGSKRIMGWQGHSMRMDEPPPEQIFSEAIPRLNSKHGNLRITMTPTPESPPLVYLRKQVEAGNLVELQTTITLDAVTPRGSLVEVPWMSQAEIEEALRRYLPDELPMRRDGAWEGFNGARWLPIGEALLRDALPRGQAWHLAIGIDHGTKPGRQCATLVACATDGSELWILDEAREDAMTSAKQDARNILAMLKRNDLGWRDVDVWVGDRRHAGDFFNVEKTNWLLTRALADELRIPQPQLAAHGLRIFTPRKRAGSVRRGFRILQSLAIDDQLRVCRRCAGFIEGANGWTGRPEDPLKDPLDSARYAVEQLLEAKLFRLKVESVGRYI